MRMWDVMLMSMCVGLAFGVMGSFLPGFEGRGGFAEFFVDSVMSRHNILGLFASLAGTFFVSFLTHTPAPQVLGLSILGTLYNMSVSFIPTTFGMIPGFPDWLLYLISVIFAIVWLAYVIQVLTQTPWKVVW